MHTCICMSVWFKCPVWTRVLSSHFGQVWVSSLAFLPQVVWVYEYKHRHLEDCLIDRVFTGKKIVCSPLEPWPHDLCISKLSARPLLPDVYFVLWIRSQMARWLFTHQIAVPLLHQWTYLSWQWPIFKNKLWLLQECCMLFYKTKTCQIHMLRAKCKMFVL